jgi:nicotinate-nucleotide adenylyltransferase
MGQDSLHDMANWREPEEIIALARLAVAGREEGEGQRVARFGDRVVWIDMPNIGVSATDVRGRAAVGRSVRYLVPDGVREYIESKGLYRTVGGRGSQTVLE